MLIKLFFKRSDHVIIRIFMKKNVRNKQYAQVKFVVHTELH